MVRQEAEKYWPPSEPPMAESVMVKVTYFYDAVSVDVDNIVKPIQDALVGLIYIDDDQVTDVLSRKRSLNGTFRVESEILAEGFTRGNEFLYVKIEEAPREEEVE